MPSAQTKLGALAALAALAFTPSIASAHWEYSRWDMTPAQLIAASKGKAVAEPLNHGNSINLQQFLASADHQMGPHAFKAKFYFEQGAQLTLVLMELKDSAGCDRLEADLVKRYGPKSPTGKAFWVDEKSGDYVEYVDDRSWKMGCRLMVSKP